MKLGKNTIQTLETIFSVEDPIELAQVLDFDADEFKAFIEEENIAPDEGLKTFIEALQEKKKITEESSQTKAAVASAGFSRRGLTQTEIINQLSSAAGIRRADVKEIFNSLASLAALEIRKNGEFTLPGFGKLVRTTRKNREGRNPATGELIKIPSKTTVKFRLGKAMKDAVE